MSARSDDINIAVLAALGISAGGVAEATISLKAGQLPTVTVTRWVQQGDALVQVVQSLGLQAVPSRAA